MFTSQSEKHSIATLLGLQNGYITIAISQHKLFTAGILDATVALAFSSGLTAGFYVLVSKIGCLTFQSLKSQYTNLEGRCSSACGEASQHAKG
jgi:hypothetical protein